MGLEFMAFLTPCCSNQKTCKRLMHHQPDDVFGRVIHWEIQPLLVWVEVIPFGIEIYPKNPRFLHFVGDTSHILEGVKPFLFSMGCWGWRVGYLIKDWVRALGISLLKICFTKSFCSAKRGWLSWQTMTNTWPLCANAWPKWVIARQNSLAHGFPQSRCRLYIAGCHPMTSNVRELVEALPGNQQERAIGNDIGKQKEQISSDQNQERFLFVSGVALHPPALDFFERPLSSKIDCASSHPISMCKWFRTLALLPVACDTKQFGSWSCVTATGRGFRSHLDTGEFWWNLWVLLGGFHPCDMRRKAVKNCLS